MTNPNPNPNPSPSPNPHPNSNPHLGIEALITANYNRYPAIWDDHIASTLHAFGYVEDPFVLNTVVLLIFGVFFRILAIVALYVVNSGAQM